jgi:putative two-component system response regulator
MDNRQDKLKILVVDADQSNIRMIQDLLKNEYEMDEAYNGAEAIERMDQYFDEYALVLMNASLPVINGFAALEVMNRRRWTEYASVVIMSSEDPYGHMDRAYELGAADYIVLPQDLIFMRRRLENCIRHFAYLRYHLSRQRMENSAPKDKKEYYDKAGIIRHMKAMLPYHEVVRLVDVNHLSQYTLTEDGELIEGEHYCYEVWKRFGRCENCISCKAIKCNAKKSKFEFIGSDAYFIISCPVVVDEKDYALELVNKVESNSLIYLMEREESFKVIKEYDRKLYLDPLTGAYNRSYVNEALIFSKISALCMIDIDYFKEVNDKYGHDAGDQALKTAAYVIMSQIRKTDTLVRYGGDEFLLLFSDMPEEPLKKRLEKIRQLVESYRLKDYPDLRMTLSIGGIVCDICNEEAIKRADGCLYQAKINRNHVVFEA